MVKQSSLCFLDRGSWSWNFWGFLIGWSDCHFSSFSFREFCWSSITKLFDCRVVGKLRRTRDELRWDYHRVLENYWVPGEFYGHFDYRWKPRLSSQLSSSLIPFQPRPPDVGCCCCCCCFPTRYWSWWVRRTNLWPWQHENSRSLESRVTHPKVPLSRAPLPLDSQSRWTSPPDSRSPWLGDRSSRPARFSPP